MEKGMQIFWYRIPFSNLTILSLFSHEVGLLTDSLMALSAYVFF